MSVILKGPDQYNRTIVAIGYSAGGQDALMSFFDQTPCDDVTYVIVRHFPVNQQSFLQKILQKHSELKVVEAAEGMVLENNKVYISPPHSYITVLNEKFSLVPRNREKPGVNRGIDVFFESLANEQGVLKIAVILSGFERDGASGAALIKQQGGRVIVQHPDTCFAPDMPIATMNATTVDHVTVPEAMPNIIQSYTKRFAVQK